MTAKSRDVSAGRMYAIELRVMRTRLLILLDHCYPRYLDEIEIGKCDEINHGLEAIRRELYYLDQKGLIIAKEIADRRLSAALTAKGRDFLAGDVAEVGLVPASDFDYSGPN